MNLSKLKPEDRPYVSRVITYLKNIGLGVRLVGSALRGDKKYEDVDLLVTGPAFLRLAAVNGLVEPEWIEKLRELGYTDLIPFRRDTDEYSILHQLGYTDLIPFRRDTDEYSILHHSGDSGVGYAGEADVERLTVKLGNTKIDLAFAKK